MIIRAYRVNHLVYYRVNTVIIVFRFIRVVRLFRTVRAIRAIKVIKEIRVHALPICRRRTGHPRLSAKKYMTSDHDSPIGSSIQT